MSAGGISLGSRWRHEASGALGVIVAVDNAFGSVTLAALEAGDWTSTPFGHEYELVDVSVDARQNLRTPGRRVFLDVTLAPRELLEHFTRDA